MNAGGTNTKERNIQCKSGRLLLKAVIKKHGGTSAVSREAGIPKRTVESWNQTAVSKRTPPEWLPSLLDDALEYRKLKKGK